MLNKTLYNLKKSKHSFFNLSSGSIINMDLFRKRIKIKTNADRGKRFLLTSTRDIIMKSTDVFHFNEYYISINKLMNEYYSAILC